MKHLALIVLLCLGPLAGLAQSQPAAQPATQPARRPIVIFLLIDDMGYADLSCYGQRAVATPHVDRVAAEGVRFAQFYVSAPICSPSRAALLTGQSPGGWRITWIEWSKISAAYTREALAFIKAAGERGRPFYVNLWLDDVHSPFFPPAALRVEARPLPRRG